MKRFIFQDFEQSSATGDPEDRPRVLTVAGLSVFLLRLAQWFGRFTPRVAGALKELNHVLTGADIAWRAQIGPGLRLNHPTGVVIGPYARIGRNCVLQSGITIGGRGSQDMPTIGDDVRIGAGAMVLGGIHLGDRCVVGANAVVIRDVAADSTTVGFPHKGTDRTPS